MARRRQEKMARVIKEAVSEIIQNRLGDPRIEGFVGVTEVNLPPDLKTADVHLSIMGSDEAHQRRTFAAIEHAAGHIQALVGQQLTMKFCPRLHFHVDDRLKKTAETLRLIEEVSKDLRECPDEEQ